jgi:hypothetical protein
MAVAAVSLELRTIPVANKNGVQREAPAVHKLWTEARLWTAYRAPDQEELALPGAADAWLAMADGVETDLCWLLRLKANRCSGVRPK